MAAGSAGVSPHYPCASPPGTPPAAPQIPSDPPQGATVVLNGASPPASASFLALHWHHRDPPSKADLGGGVGGVGPPPPPSGWWGGWMFGLRWLYQEPWGAPAQHSAGGVRGFPPPQSPGVGCRGSRFLPPPPWGAGLGSCCLPLAWHRHRHRRPLLRCGGVSGKLWAMPGGVGGEVKGHVCHPSPPPLQPCRPPLALAATST